MSFRLYTFVLSVLFVLSTAFAKTSDVDPVIKDLSKLIGGKWVGTIGSGNQTTIVEFEWTWHPDKKGLLGKGIIGKGSEHPIYANVTLGFDAKAGKVFYLDTHNTDTIYYGLISPDNGGFLYEFGPIGGNPREFKTRDRFLNDDLKESEFLDKNGNSMFKFQVKRVK